MLAPLQILLFQHFCLINRKYMIFSKSGAKKTFLKKSWRSFEIEIMILRGSSVPILKNIGISMWNSRKAW